MLVLTVALPALAQQINGGLGRDLRLAGVVDAPATITGLGTLRIRIGDRQRTLTVTAAQTSAEEGMAIFRQVIQYRENLRLVAAEPVLRAIRLAAPGTPVRIVGFFQPDIRNVLVSSIELVGGDL